VVESGLILKFQFKDPASLADLVELRNLRLSTLVGSRDLFGPPLGGGSCDMTFLVRHKDRDIRPRGDIVPSSSRNLGSERATTGGEIRRALPALFLEIRIFALLYKRRNRRRDLSR